MKTKLNIIIALLIFTVMLIVEIAMPFTKPLYVWVLAGITVLDIALCILGGKDE